MKSKFKLIVLLVLASTLLAAASGTEYTRQFRKAWAKNSVSVLKVTNKFGEVKINDTGGDSVTIKVVIKVDHDSQNKAHELMNKIHIDFQKTGSLVSAETTIDNNFQSRKSFSIDYLINIPKDKELNVTNKYGNVILNELDGKGFFDVSYGSMTAGKMKAPQGSPIKVIVNYGKADLETINDADLEIKYSKLYVDAIEHLNLDSRYSTANIQKLGVITLDSKYDGVEIGEVGQFKSVSRYTNYKIGVLTGSCMLDTGYGSVRISRIDSKFDKIQIVNSYGGINLGLNELNYKLNADCDYCDINYPHDRYKGNRIKENHRFSLDGTIGNGGGNVSITSKYGEIKLTE
jgi:hypothetical protein